MGLCFIDENEEYVEIVDVRGRKSSLLKYSNIDFKLVEKSSFPNLHYNSCRKGSDTYYF